MSSEKHNTSKWIGNILIHFGLTVLASILFAGSFPNPLFINGLPLLAWFAYIPVLIVISKYNILACAGWGAVYGFTSYLLFNFWLGNFHPLASTIVNSVYMIYLAVVFVLFKLAVILFPKQGYLVQWIIWLSYEYLRTLGFLGYPYGITGYSQWRMIPLIQIASITGIWGISALVTFPSFWLSAAFQDFYHKGEEGARGEEKNKKLKILCDPLCSFVVKFFFKEKVSAAAWLAVLAAALIFGFINLKDYSSYPAARIALIQHNTDPWEAARAPVQWQITESYRRDLAALIRLSDEALAHDPGPQMVVWPETAFIPRIYWHTTYRDDQNSWPIVRDLLLYLSSQDVPFLIGNDDARRDPSINPDPEKRFRVDYNAAMLFEKGINTELYRKLHLVPFTEHFPYQRQFPWVYEALLKAETTFWEKGDEETVFSGPGFKFSTPICFEDSFGYLSRNFVRGGADVLVNLSNDAWSKSLTAQYQHLAMAVFRAVENNRPMVRSTTSGQTCAIDPNGRIIAMAAPFEETWLNTSVPLVKGSAIYTLYGDYLGVFFTFLSGILLISRAAWCTMRKRKSAKNEQGT